jgi:hypothetical protein
MQPVIERLEKALGPEACRVLLADSLRDLPDYAWEREIYQSCPSVEEYLVKKKQKFMEQMETCQREGRLFFAQEVTDEVLDFIRSEPEMGGGVRVGNIVYETKIPFLTKEYLAESDPTLKCYYYCHCPWAREAVKSGERLPQSSAIAAPGSTKKPGKARSGKRSKSKYWNQSSRAVTAAALPFICPNKTLRLPHRTRPGAAQEFCQPPDPQRSLRTISRFAV